MRLQSYVKKLVHKILFERLEYVPASRLLCVSSCCESDMASSSTYPLCSGSSSDSALFTSVSSSLPVASASCNYVLSFYCF